MGWTKSQQTNQWKHSERGRKNSYRCGPPKYNCSLQVEESVGVHLKHYKNSQVLAMMICSCVCVCARWGEMHQGMKVTGCDSRQFMLLCLNCHLMCVQSGTLSKKRTLPHCGVRRWGAKTNVIKPAPKAGFTSSPVRPSVCLSGKKNPPAHTKTSRVQLKVL